MQTTVMNTKILLRYLVGERYDIKTHSLFSLSGVDEIYLGGINQCEVSEKQSDLYDWTYKGAVAPQVIINKTKLCNVRPIKR